MLAHSCGRERGIAAGMVGVRTRDRAVYCPSESGEVLRVDCVAEEKQNEEHRL